MQYILYLTYVVPPRKSESEGVEASVIDAENVADPKLTSSTGVKTRSMSLSPTSPGPTRRMASILPGGINRRLIIS